MQCPNCFFSSESDKFSLSSRREERKQTENKWVKNQILKKKFRTCPKCDKFFEIGVPRLIRVERTVKDVIPLTTRLAEKSKKLLSRKRSFSLFDVQKLFAIPFPSDAEELMDSIALSGILKVIHYPPTTKNDPKLIYKFNEDAKNEILKTLGLRTIHEEDLTKIQTIINEFSRFNPRKPQSIKLAHIIRKQMKELVFYDTTTDSRIAPSIYNRKYYSVLKTISFLVDLVESEKIITTKKLVDNISSDFKVFNNLKSSLIGILGNKLMYYNTLASRNPMHIPPIPIPIEVNEEITRLEIDLRSFIIKILVINYNNIIKDAYDYGIPSKIVENKNVLFKKFRIEGMLKKQLEFNAKINESRRGKNLLVGYNKSGISSIDLFKQFMQQTDFNHLILLIKFHWENFFLNIFHPYRIDEIVSYLKLIKDARNIEAHRKYKEAELVKVIESLFVIREGINKT